MSAPEEVVAARRWFADDLRHVARTGYYTAIIADIVGPGGAVTAVEIDGGLAAQARANLATRRPQANVINADGFAFRSGRPADAIIVNAGVTHLSTVWLDALAESDGRLLVPLTAADRFGAFILITRRKGEARCDARHVCRVGMIDCIGGRDPVAERSLLEALRKSRFAPPIRSLRRPPDEPDETCWLSGDGWWLSTAAPDA